MVVPRRHTAEFGTLPEPELVDLHRLLQRSVRIVNESYQPAGLNLGMNLGRPRARASPIICTTTSFRDGTAIRTSCR